MKHTDPPFREVSIYIQQEGENKFKIQSDQLEQIGAQLRGRRQFSIFQSIILPLIVGGSIFTYLLQYVSWSNAVAVQNATEIATNAARTYKEVAAAMSTRQYAMFVFFTSLRALLNEGHSKEASVEKRKPDAEKKPQPSTVDASTSAASTEETTDFEFLHKLELNIKQQRFASYYEQIKLWQENYDRLLSEIEITLDRPVFLPADERDGFIIYYDFFRRINCSESTTEELKRLNFNPQSLKVRFEAINRCFMDLSFLLDQQLTARSTTEVDETKFMAIFFALRSHLNGFRCYALRRLDYYNREKQLSIFFVAWSPFTQTEMMRAREHLKDIDNRCDPPYAKR